MLIVEKREQVDKIRVKCRLRTDINQETKHNKNETSCKRTLQHAACCQYKVDDKKNACWNIAAEDDGMAEEEEEENEVRAEDGSGKRMGCMKRKQPH